MILFALLQRLFALASLFVLGLAGWLTWDWWSLERRMDDVGLDASNERLYWAIGLLAFSLLGRLPVLVLLGRSGSSFGVRRPGRKVQGTGASPLWLEQAGADEGPIVLLTHGWGMNVRIWGQTLAALERRFGVAAWDLPGAGKSGRPGKGWSIEGFADDLAAIVRALPSERPVVLVGHSIGGMTIQTFCARRPELLGGRVRGVVLENTTHHDPLKTMVFSKPLTAMQPLIELMMKLDILLSPVVWLMNWQSYLSGSTHLAMRIAGFGSRPTRAQLDLAALLPTRTSPAVQAHGNLAMLRWGITDALPRLEVPALVFVGSRDLVTKDHAGERIAGLMPNARLVRIDDAGHMGPVERHEAYDEAVADFVAQVCADEVTGSQTSMSPRRVLGSKPGP